MIVTEGQSTPALSLRGKTSFSGSPSPLMIGQSTYSLSSQGMMSKTSSPSYFISEGLCVNTSSLLTNDVKEQSAQCPSASTFESDQMLLYVPTTALFSMFTSGKVQSHAGKRPSSLHPSSS